MIQELQALLNSAVRGGIVLGNGIQMYSPPTTLSSDNDMYTLNDMDGVMLEHFANFEQLLPSGKLNVPLVAQALTNVQQAAAQGKFVVMCTWPGPLSGPFDAKGFPIWKGAQTPTTFEGWRAALLQYHDFALAAFLTVAEPNVWMQYQLWYNGFNQGAIPCDSSPSTCPAPSSAAWYPKLYLALGLPLGPAARSGNVWMRKFQYATSVLNLDDPVNGSNVTLTARERHF